MTLSAPAVGQAQRVAREPVDLPGAEPVRATGHKHGGPTTMDISARGG